MSEVKLNLVDNQHVLTGTIHGSVAERCVAALSAEPETTSELAAALGRYIRDKADPFAFFHSNSEIDSEPWDAGLVVIDLAARVVASESTYCDPSPEGEVSYHDGTQATDIRIPYRLPADWRFVNSIDAYRWSRERRYAARQSTPPLDTRSVLYGPALFEFIVESFRSSDRTGLTTDDAQARARLIISIHRAWLMTPRDDLRGKTPREVLLEKQDLIDFDLHTRCLQWTFVGEGPPCLSTDAFAYSFAGFGTHEWVLYYYLVRFLLEATAEVYSERMFARPADGVVLEKAEPDGNEVRPATAPAYPRVGSEPPLLIPFLDHMKTKWLEEPNDDYDGRIPALIIENERKRLPQTMSAKEIIIDEDCDWCRMAAMEAEMGFGPAFWHLDGCNMEDEFAFSSYVTREEWEAENYRREEFAREFDRESYERRQRDHEFIDGELYRNVYDELDPDLSELVESDSTEPEHSN